LQDGRSEAQTPDWGENLMYLGKSLCKIMDFIFAGKLEKHYLCSKKDSLTYKPE